MKQYALLTIIITVFFSNFSVAQNAKELAKTASDGLCGCVNDTYSNIDNDVKKAMVKIIKYQMNGQQQEMEDYAAALSPDLQTRIQEQAALFSENQKMFDLCVEEVEQTMAAYTLDNESDITEEQFINMMMDEMATTKACKFAHLLMQLGLAEEAKNNTSNNGQVNNSQYEKPKPQLNTNEGSGGN